MDKTKEAYFAGVNSSTFADNPYPKGSAEYFEWNVGRCDSPLFHPSQPPATDLVAVGVIVILVLSAVIGSIIDVL